MFSKAVARVVTAREYILAAALPDANEYMQLQSQVLLLSSDRASATDDNSLVPVRLSPRGTDVDARLSLLWDDDDNDQSPTHIPVATSPEMTRAQHRLISSLKTSLDGPLDSGAVRSSWIRAWTLVPLVIGMALAIGLIVWLMVDH